MASVKINGVEFTPDPLKTGSSDIAGACYNASMRMLVIQFSKGDIYSYEPVSVDAYNEFEKAVSPGSYFHQNIAKNPNVHAQKREVIKDEKGLG